MISICIVANNSEKYLEEALNKLYKAEVEIVVVDFYSTDNSIEAAKKYTDSVYTYDWGDCFSDARSYAIGRACNDLILVLDADEYLDSCELLQIERFFAKNPEMVGKIEIKSVYMDDSKQKIETERLERIFDRRYYSYFGEKNYGHVTRNDGAVYNSSDVPFRAFRYVGIDDDTKDEIVALNNLNVLLNKIDANQHDPYLLYSIGKIYYNLKIYNKAIEYFCLAMEEQIDTSLDYVADLVVCFGYSLINTEKFDQAMVLEALYNDFCNNADYLFVMGLIYMKNAKFNLAIETFLKAASCPKSQNSEIDNCAAFYNIGVIFECLGDKKNALNYYNRCGDYAPAKEGIGRCS